MIQADPSNDDTLLALLSTLGEDDPRDRRAALLKLGALPAEFWTEERREGALSTLVPLAEAEADDATASALVEVLGALLDAPGQGEPLEHLGDLAHAPAPATRAFLARTLGRLPLAQATPLLLSALAEEPQAEIARALLAPLRQLDAAPPAEPLARLLRAPTDDARRFAVEAAGAWRIAQIRPDMIDALSSPTVALHDEVRAALDWALARIAAADARGLAEQLWPDARAEADPAASGAETLLLRQAGGESARLRVSLVFRPGSAAPRRYQRLPAEVELRVELHTPQRRYLDRLQIERLGEALCRAMLSSPSSLECQTSLRLARATLTIPLDARPAMDLLAAAKPTVELLAGAFHSLNRTPAHAVEESLRAWEQLCAALDLLAEREAALRRAFPEAHEVIGPHGHAYLVLQRGQQQTTPFGPLHRDDIPHIEFAIAQRLDALTTTTPAAGLRVAVALGLDAHTEQLDALLNALAAAMRWRLGVRTQPLQDEQPIERPLLSPSALTNLHARACLAGVPDEDAPASGEELADAYRGVGQFLAAFADLVGGGTPTLVAAGLQDMLPVAPLPSPLPAPRATTAPDEARPPAPTPAAAPIVAAPRTTPPAAATPAPIIPLPARSVAPSSSAPASADRTLDELGASTSEIVRNIPTDIAMADVHLRSAGHSTTKLVTIMAILLSISTEHATNLVERAPCLLIANIPRARARQIRTVLEGTGARILITEHGQPGDEASS